MGNYTPNPFMTQPVHLPPLNLSCLVASLIYLRLTMGALAWISSTMTLGTLPSTTLQKLIHSAWAGPCYVPLIVSIILSQFNVE